MDKRINNDIVKNSTGRFETLFENIPDAVFIASFGGPDSGTIISVNSAAAEQTGYSKEELIGKNIRIHLQAEYYEHELDGAVEKRLGNTPLVRFREKKRRKDGSEYWTEVLVKKAELNGRVVAIGVNRDISDQVQVETALKRSEEKFRSFIENSGIGFAVDDREGNIIYFNNMFPKLFGYTPDEIRKESYDSLIHPENIQFAKRTHRLRMEGKNLPLNYELKCIKKDGSNIFLDVSVDKILQEGGRVTGSQMFFRDITTRKMAEAELLNLKNSLEIQVEEKTNALRQKVVELQRFHDATIEREFRIKDLKDRIAELEKKQAQSRISKS